MTQSETTQDSITQDNKALIDKFYHAFQSLDGSTMAQCYHPDATFSDEAFDLTGTDIGMMWKMLCSQAKGFSLEFSEVQCDEKSGKAHWEPKYDFSLTGRKVHNIVDAEFTFKDGLIYNHRDCFDFWRWSRQALGIPGLLFGWSDFFKDKVKQTANRNLTKYIAKNS